MAFYQRRLPHWHPQGRPVFFTWRLRGSLPPSRVFPASTMSSGKAFVAMDRLLDNGRTGPLHLARPDVARMMVEAILQGQNILCHYTLHAFVVMANHIHLLITPLVPTPKLLQSLKGITARRANQTLGLTGQAFWQEESYDRWVRDDKEFRRNRAYIEENPVRAGLVVMAEDYPWSSASQSLAARAGLKPGCGPGGPPHDA